MTTIFGPSIGKRDVERAVAEHLQAWLPTYLAVVRDKYSLTDEIPAIRGWTTRSRFDKFPEDQVPLLILSSPGTEGKPEIEGDGSYSVMWRADVAVLCSAATEEQTKDLAGYYAEAVRNAMVQHGSLGDFAAATVYRDEDYDAFPEDADRSAGACAVRFFVLVGDVVNRFGGPTSPLEPPYVIPEEWPPFETHEVEVEKT